MPLTVKNTNTRNINLCIASRNLNAYCETFIRAHREQLPCNIVTLFGGDPWKNADGTPLVSDGKGAVDGRQKTNENGSFQSLVDFFQRQEVDAVLAEYGTIGVELLPATQAAGIPLLVHLHGFDAYQDSVFAQHGAAYSELFQKANATLVVSRHMEARMASFGVPEDRLHHVACGVSEIFQKPAAPEMAPPHFVAVGRFVDKKGPHLTILAFHQVWKKVPEATLTMIGTGPLLESCSHMLKAIGMDNAVDLKRICSHDAVANTMRAARAFVQHSVCTSDHDMEGTPVAVMEAGVCGLPVVATRHGGITDVIKDRRTGFLVNEHDIEAMAQRMLLLAQEPSLAGKMGAENRRQLQESCSMGRSIEALWRVIRDTVEEHRASDYS